MVNGVEYDYLLSSGNWYVSDLEGSVLVTGDARLFVRDEIDIQGNDALIIKPTGSLDLYMAGPRTQFGGNGVINEPGNAINFKYWGLPSNTRIDMSGSSAFAGVIYAPQAEFNLGGGGKNSLDFVGASVTESVKMNGHYKFHYDEALNQIGPVRGYVPTSWNEIDVAQALPTAAFAGVDYYIDHPPIYLR